MEKKLVKSKVKRKKNRFMNHDVTKKECDMSSYNLSGNNTNKSEVEERKIMDS